MNSRSQAFSVTGIALCLGAFLGILATYVGLLYSGQKQDALDDLDRRLLMAAGSLDHLVPEEFFERAIGPDGVRDVEDRHNIQRLTSLADELEVSYLYTLFYTNGMSYITSSSASPEETAKGEEVRFFTAYPEMVDATRDAIGSSRPIYANYRDRWGEFRHVYIPRQTTNGVTYLLCADYDLATLRTTLRDRTKSSLALSLLLFLAPLPFFVHYRRHRRQHLLELTSLNAQLKEDIRRREVAEQAMREQERAKEALMLQLEQSRRLEAIGKLAGGVAHDFNNLLMGIMNYVELCRDDVELEHPIREWLDEITHDAERSAALVRQLLAFARRQTIAPKVLDLNDAVTGTLKMLRRLIGEDINLLWQPGVTLPPVKIDPTQLDQILANLCVNARDAVAGVGKVTIETSKATINPQYCAEHAEAIPGDFVVLGVSDDGCGMDSETMANIFEPFFTTKTVGEGTGLGLATTYGIVKQNGGFVNVYSELGHGTTFRIYLPRCEEKQTAAATSTDETPRIGGDETIALVEDEKSVRVTTRMFLRDLGYTVLDAEDPEEALRLAEGHDAEIHLMITDVVMPGMDGRALSAKLAETYPRMRCLFMSGYTANVIAHRGILEENVHFLSKPFTRDELARKVREVLDE